MSKALILIQNVVSETLARLEQEAASAQAAYEQALRAAILEGECDGVLQQLKLEVAALIIPVRKDGYYSADIIDAKPLLRAAWNAEVITQDVILGSVRFWSDFSGIADYGTAAAAQQAAGFALRKLEAYRAANAAK